MCRRLRRFKCGVRLSFHDLLSFLLVCLDAETRAQTEWVNPYLDPNPSIKALFDMADEPGLIRALMEMPVPEAKLPHSLKLAVFFVLWYSY